MTASISARPEGSARSAPSMSPASSCASTRCTKPASTTTSSKRPTAAPATDPELRKSLEPMIARRMTYSGLCRFQMTLATILTDLMGAAVFERFPNIRVVFGESGIGWIPYVIDRMDFEYQDQYQDLKLKMLPSEYWRRQCKATFQFDRVGTKLIDEMGIETLMWGSDYPHPDGVWPESKKYIEEQFSHLPAEVTYKMTCENAGKFYGLIN